VSHSNDPNSEIAEILDAVEQRDAQAEQVIEIEEQKTQLVVIVLDDQYYAFYGAEIKEIVPVGTITYVPGMPDYLPGVMNVRGEIEAVLDLRRVLMLSPTPLTRRSRVMIGEAQAIRSGILVDAVEDVVEVPTEAIHQPISTLDTDWAAYLVKESLYNDQQLIILSVAKIFEHLLHE
jgi:purine-binding chemotaxis protein CheW